MSNHHHHHGHHNHHHGHHNHHEEDLEKEKKHHKHLEHLGEATAVAAGAYALVLESAIQLEKNQANPIDQLSKHALVEKGQVTAMAALTELRKISNLLREM